jgi:hypothetical protein
MERSAALQLIARWSSRIWENSASPRSSVGSRRSDERVLGWIGAAEHVGADRRSLAIPYLPEQAEQSR